MQCPRCQGSGKCKECDGLGYTECSACDGQGRKATPRGIGYDCKSCRGTGRVECPAECSSCSGSGVITERLQRETRDKYHMKFADFTPSRALTGPLLVVLLAIHVLVRVKPDLTPYFLVWNSSLAAGHYWTLFTPGLLHTGTFHLLMNLLFLYYWGPIAEGLSGRLRYLALYLTTSVAATLVSYLGNVVFEGNVLAGHGASGFGFGLVGYLVVLHLRWGIGPKQEVTRIGYLATIILTAGFASQFWGIHYLDNWGHLGGLLAGGLLALLLPRPKGH